MDLPHPGCMVIRGEPALCARELAPHACNRLGSISFRTVPSCVRCMHWGARGPPHGRVRSNCRRLETSSGPRKVVPVTFPPGRARLVTSSSATGSAMATATIGIVPVSCLAGRAAVVLNATMISGLRLTNSAASSAKLIRTPICISAFYGEVLSLRVPKFAQSLEEGVEHVEGWIGKLGAAG